MKRRSDDRPGWLLGFLQQVRDSVRSQAATAIAATILGGGGVLVAVFWDELGTTVAIPLWAVAPASLLLLGSVATLVTQRLKRWRKRSRTFSVFGLLWEVRVSGLDATSHGASIEMARKLVAGPTCPECRRFVASDVAARKCGGCGLRFDEVPRKPSEPDLGILMVGIRSTPWVDELRLKVLLLVDAQVRRGDRA